VGVFANNVLEHNGTNQNAREKTDPIAILNVPVAHQKEKCRTTDQNGNYSIIKGDNNFFRKFLGAAIKVEVRKETSNEPSQSNDQCSHKYPT
jgi:hypothetical protein